MKAAVWFLLAWMAASAAQARILYVSAAGARSAPYRTIAAAVAAARAGDEIHILPGRYQENVRVELQGTRDAPILITGESADPAQYPVVDGGDAGFQGPDRPAFQIENSRWLIFERIKVVNSTKASFAVVNSNYIVLRRVQADYHSAGVLLNGSGTHHVLVERSEFWQSYGPPDAATWRQVKGSKWEGGAIYSRAAAGFVVVRYNRFGHMFNGIIQSDLRWRRLPNGRAVAANDPEIPGWMGANWFVYKNYFENVGDDCFEPESGAFNNHYFNNTHYNNARVVSLAPVAYGPVYCYRNIAYAAAPPLGSGAGMWKLGETAGGEFFREGVFLFQNSFDAHGMPGAVGMSWNWVDADVQRHYAWNNAYFTGGWVAPPLEKISQSEIDFELGKSVSHPDDGFSKELLAKGHQRWAEPALRSQEPRFRNPAKLDFRLEPGSPAIDKARRLTFQAGFADPEVNGGYAGAGPDIGALESTQKEFPTTPEPVYVVPPGGDVFESSEPFPVDWRGGANPVFGPAIMAEEAPKAPARPKCSVRAGRIEVEWTAIVGASNYTVRRSAAAGGPYRTVARGLTGAGYRERARAPAEGFRYTVTARNEAGESEPSPESVCGGPAVASTGAAGRPAGMEGN